jgi:pyruvate,water dikinase
METLSQLQIYNQWPYFFATFTTWAFRWLAVDYMGFSHGDFLNRLSHNASNVTIEIERNFRNMASEIARDADLTARFLNESAYQLTADLPQNLKNWLDNFLSRYGCRSRHRTLLIKRWYEAPDEVIGILQSLVRNRQLSSTPDLSENGLVVSKTGENAVESKDKAVIDGKKHFFLSRWVLWLITRFTRIFLDLRENLRFALDRILYLLRQSLLTIGSQIDLGENVLFLNADELEGFVSGDLSFKKLKLKARHRRDMFTKPFDVATYFNNGRSENEFDSNGVVLHGIGTSPGRVQGHAKIVDDPALADIQSSDILIAKNTDPGWTPIMSIVRGMVVEEGGLLNHCSIVARELGVPTVVGVHHATQQIHDNDLITIDGGLGFVRIEE